MFCAVDDTENKIINPNKIRVLGTGMIQLNLYFLDKCMVLKIFYGTSKIYSLILQGLIKMTSSKDEKMIAVSDNIIEPKNRSSIFQASDSSCICFRNT